ncbi:O-fucosyltransferase family protein [Phanerochaete sordida]|uniref:O-fucosyltransferase family protein n=1 Tax=Phanerochaete sordida TaxID=48140 RepID=A0A9P3LBE5_9APHY|nr:O-fucosyltransferase family protein [Phanerochaete sordida]
MFTCGTPVKDKEPPLADHGKERPIPLTARAGHFVKRRCIVVGTTVIALIGLYAIGTVLVLIGLFDDGLERTRALWRSIRVPGFHYEPLPPLYPEYHRAELALPQHDHPGRAFEGGKKHMWVADHMQLSGFGDYMQDMILNAQLVFETGRSYVFDNYTWDRDGPEYADFHGVTIPSRIPLSALISGPIVGGPFFDNDGTPRAVVKEYWDLICPNPTIVRADEIRELRGEGADARKIIDAWVNHIKDIDDPCIKVERHSGSIFHISMFGTPGKILPIWSSLSQSPILQLFGWSSLAHREFEANRHLFAPAPLVAPYVTAPDCPQCVDPHAHLDRLLALHIPHGDFLQHCPDFAARGAGFSVFNMFPSFPDLWVPPSGDEEQRRAVYRRRCRPTVAQVLEKVEAVRASAAGRGLRSVYVMSNADPGWLNELKDALRAAVAWDQIATSRDLVLTPEQKYTSQALDMLIGERAEVLIGNGFSSMSSSIAMLRMARGQPPETIRMW